MTHAKTATGFIALALLLAACKGGDGDSSKGAGFDPPASAQSRNATRSDGEVMVLPNLSPGFTATQTITISHNDGGAGQGVVTLENVSGGLTSSAAASAGYEIQITLKADAPTEAQAREALATMSVEHSDALGGGTLYLGNRVRYAKYQANNVSRSATVSAALPPALSYRLEQNSVSGANASSGLHGPSVWMNNTSGALTLAGTWDEAAANSVSGGVTVSGDIADLQASTTSGTLTSRLTGNRSSSAQLDAVSGAIDATVATSAGAGYDLEAHTTSGTATIAVAVAGTQPVGQQSARDAHYRSANYASSNPKISVYAQTTSGSVNIHQ